MGYFEGTGGQVDPTGHVLAYVDNRSIYTVNVDELGTVHPKLVGQQREPIQEIKWLPDGGRIASLSETGDIQIWSLASGSTDPVRELEDTDAMNWLAFNDSGSLLAARTGDRRAHLWDLAGPPDSAPIALQRGLDTPNTVQIGFHPGGQWLVTANQMDVAFWPLSRPYSHVFRLGDEEWITSVAFAPDGDWLASSSAEQKVRWWPLSGKAGARNRVVFPEDLSTYPIMKMDPWGLRLVVEGSPGKLWIVPFENEPREVLTGFSSPSSFVAAALGPRGRLFAASLLRGPAEEKVIRVVDLDSGEVRVLGPLEGAGDGVVGRTDGLGFTPGGRLLSCGAYGLVLWNLEDGSVEVLERHPYSSLVVSPDGRRLLLEIAAEETSNNLVLYDVENRTSQPLTSHGHLMIGAGTFDPTGQLIVTGDTDGVIRVGSIGSAEPHLLFGHKGWILSVAVSPDGRWLASSGVDGTIRMWPMPDMNQPPFHTLPYEEFLDRLRALTNLRAVPDGTASTGYKVEPGPFPGWKTVPTW